MTASGPLAASTTAADGGAGSHVEPGHVEPGHVEPGHVEPGHVEPGQPGPAARKGTWAIICGGGTAGHVLPAIAIGQALVERGHPSSAIHFVGSRRGIEGRLVPEAGFGVTLLPGRGFVRRLSIANVAAAAGLLAAAVQAAVLVVRRRPAVVVSVGGYASVPGVVAAALARVPLVVAEQNAAPGAANRLAARLAQAAATSFDATPLPRAVVTGNPVRTQVLAVDRSADSQAAARTALGLAAHGQVVVAFGGSLGALRINQAIIGLAESWRTRSDLTIYHVVGARDWDLMSAAQPDLPADGLAYRQVRYEERMDLVYAAADVAVCRAGASTVAELAVVGLPSVLIPLPGAPNDHQTANARVLVEVGAARLVPDADATPSRLAAELDQLIGHPDVLAAMGQAGRSIAHRDAASAVARLIEQVSHV